MDRRGFLRRLAVLPAAVALGCAVKDEPEVTMPKQAAMGTTEPQVIGPPI